MDRMNRGPGQWVVDVTRNYREAGGLAEADAFFVGLQPVVETVVGESLATPPLRDPNMALQVLAQEDLVDARVGLTPLNELTSLMGVRAVRVDNPAVAKDCARTSRSSAAPSSTPRGSSVLLSNPSLSRLSFPRSPQ